MGQRQTAGTLVEMAAISREYAGAIAVTELTTSPLAQDLVHGFNSEDAGGGGGATTF